MLLPVQSGRAGQHFGVCESYEINIAILTDADKEHYEKILFSRAVARKKFD